ncbi:MAG: DUF402 domain-containing protein [Thermomicrobiales bacterium]
MVDTKRVRDLTNETTFRVPGEPVLLRFIHPDTPDGVRRAPHFVVPMRVVQDDAEKTMLYAAAGSTIRKRVHADGTSIPRDLPYAERVTLDMVVGEGMWQPYHTLSIVPAGAEYDIRYVWHKADWSFVGWYVNLQAPFQRVPTGFDSDDWLLDITVEPDGRWAWKDEDELADAVEVGAVTARFAERVRGVGEAVIRMIETRSWPFDGSLVAWRPDPAWGPLAVPEGWDVLPEAVSHD